MVMTNACGSKRGVRGIMPPQSATGHGLIRRLTVCPVRPGAADGKAGAESEE